MKAQLAYYQARIQHAIANQLNQVAKQNNCPETLQAALSYTSLNSGKRVRPVLGYALAEALKVPLEQVDPALCALELIHCYSLVHDDLPAMDDDDLRRGQPTCHIQFNEATAILTGDGLLTLAFEVLSNSEQLTAEHKIQMIQHLSKAAGVNGMIAGQMMDIQAEGQFSTENQLKKMHQLKTGALIQCALHLGALPADNYAEIAPKVEKLGELLGLAFQIKDDILDIESSTEVLGKPQGSDLAANKSTYPSFWGLDTAKQELNALTQQAQSLLEELSPENLFLRNFIDYLADRNY